MIYLQGKPQAPRLGIEHLQPFQSCFHWRKPEQPKPEPTEADIRAAATKLRNAAYATARHHRITKGLTKEQALALVLRKNKYSNVAMSTTGQADRSAQIRKGGI